MDRSPRLTPNVLPAASRRDFLRISGLVTLGGGAAASMTGCGMFSNSQTEGEGSHLRITFTAVEVLDPQIITNGMWILTRGILEGLVAQNPEGTGVVPAVAESWTSSEDKLTWTFTLRGDAKWSNGDAVTAQDFEETYKRLLTPSGGATGGTTAGANSYQASTGIKGATEFLSGALTDWSEVGVKATSETELVITLQYPNPDILLALTHPALLPLHMKTVTEKPDAWQEPPNFISNGPYAVTAWTKNSSLDLVPNEEYWDRQNVFYDGIRVLIVEPTASGTGSVPYENNETDILPIADADVKRFKADPELSKHVQSVETYGIAYLAKLRSENPALEDIRVRQALSKGLGRETLAGLFDGMSRPGVTLVTDRVVGWDESIALPEDLDEAKQLLADAGYPNGQGLPTIRILSGVGGTLVEAIADTWQKNLNIKVQLDTVEAGVYVERRWQVQKGDYIGFYFGTFAGLPTFPTMVGSLWSPTDVMKFSLPGATWARYQKIEQDADMSPAEKNKQLNALLEEASDGAKEMKRLNDLAFAEVDDARRTELFKQAAAVREREALYIPVLWNSINFAVRPTVGGMQLRPYPDFFYLKPLKPAGE